MDNLPCINFGLILQFTYVRISQYSSDDVLKREDTKFIGDRPPDLLRVKEEMTIHEDLSTSGYSFCCCCFLNQESRKPGENQMRFSLTRRVQVGEGSDRDHFSAVTVLS